MSALWIAAGLLAMCATWWVMRRATRSQPERSTPHKPVAPAGPAPEAPAAAVLDASASRGPVPEALAALSMRRIERLNAERLEWFAGALHEIPRPPSALNQLVSLEFVTKASSFELAELVMSEPMAAAKVLAKVHSPVFGLREPVTSIGQAITFIGVTSVRNVCLRYLLDNSFSSGNPQVKKTFETLGEASTLGSELSLRLAQRLQLPDAASLMTHVLLSFTGHLAATVLQVRVRKTASSNASMPLLQRVYLQQQELGLPGSEIGRMLMRDWKLPSSLIDGVAAIDRLLVEPVQEAPPDQAVHLAVGYLSARLGERLADGRLESFDDVEQLLDWDADFHHLNSYLALPPLRDLRRVLKAPDLIAGLRAVPQDSVA